MSACSHPLTDGKAKDERAFSPCWQFRMTLESDQSAWRKVDSSPLCEAEMSQEIWIALTVTTQYFAPCPPSVLLMLSSPLLTGTGTKMNFYLVIPICFSPQRHSYCAVPVFWHSCVCIISGMLCICLALSMNAFLWKEFLFTLCFFFFFFEELSKALGQTAIFNFHE